MSAVEEIRAAQARAPAELELGPPATAEEVARLEERAGAPLPVELREVLAVTRSIEGPLDEGIDFLGVAGGIEVPGMPRALELAGDGYGNFWVADLVPEEADVVPVFFACHDPPVVLFQSPTLAGFLREAFRRLEPPHESLIDAVQGDDAFDVWRTDHGALTRAEATAAGGDLAAFARTLEHDEFLICDLRDPSPGEGFAWGRGNWPETEVLRYGDERLFAVDRRRRPSAFRRLFGRG